MASRRSPSAIVWSTCALCWCALASGTAHAVTLAAKAKAEGCTGRPTVVQGTNLYRCLTQGGTHYFNLEAPAGDGGGATMARSGPAATPQGFPKVDTGTQKGRDDLRRRVLNEELTTEEKLLAEARVAYNNGAPPPLPEEKDLPQKYTDRVAKLRQAVSLHEKNIEALKKELAATR
jgi:hypothetical protein